MCLYEKLNLLFVSTRNIIQFKTFFFLYSCFHLIDDDKKKHWFCLGSPIELESEGNTSSQYDSVSQHSVTQLEIPQQERLLPIGTSQNMANLVQHVRQVLGVHGNRPF